MPRPTKRVGGHRAKNTPQYDVYKDETQNEQTFPQLAEELETKQEVENHSSRNTAAQRRQDGKRPCSCNANGNVMDRAITNPFSFTRMYPVEFAGYEVTKLVTNVIAESRYA